VESLRVVSPDGQVQKVFERKGEGVTSLSPSSEVKIGQFAPCMPALLSFLPADSPVVELIMPVYRSLEGIQYYAVDVVDDDADKDEQRQSISEMDYVKWRTRYLETGAPGSSVLMRLLHLVLTQDRRFEELKQLLGPNGLGLIDSIRPRVFTVGETKDQTDDLTNLYQLTFRPVMHAETSERHFSFGELSFGTRRVIRILVSLIFDSPLVMLLEHPEDGIHRGLLRKLLGVLDSYSDSTQLIITSHSSVVFNTLTPASVRLVTMEDGFTRVRPLNANELSAVGRYLEEEGTLADFLETVGD
jgi:hypothetical protein